MTIDDRAGGAPPRATIARPTCAVIEAYNRHDEVYVTTAYLLEQLGFEVHVLNTWRNRFKNSFTNVSGVRPRIASARKATGVLSLAERRSFDLVVFNTLEGAAVLDCARRLSSRTPVLGFLHNASFVSSIGSYRELLENPHVKLMVLAPYIADYLGERTRPGVMYPLFLHDRAVPCLAGRHDRRRFCVQGYFDPKRRHYDGLVDAVRKLRDEGRGDFEVWVMGRSFSKEFRAFHRHVKRLGLAPFVRYTWKGIGYRSYHRILNSVDFILPLISPETHPSYFRSKSTSSIAAAIGFDKIPIAHRRLADLYGIGDVCMTYDTDMAGMMRAALTADEQALGRLRAGVAVRASRLLDESRRQLQQAIEEVCDARSTRAHARSH